MSNSQRFRFFYKYEDRVKVLDVFGSKSVTEHAETFKGEEMPYIAYRIKENGDSFKVASYHGHEIDKLIKQGGLSI